LGADVLVRKRDIFGIFDLDTSTVSRHTRDYLAKAEKEGEIVNISQELPKTFIVCLEEGQRRIYLSQLSPQTLIKRIKGEHAGLRTQGNARGI
jgi:hypothetical protein